MQVLQEIKDNGYRIIVANIKNKTAELVLCSAYRKKMMAEQKYVWIIPDWVAKSWLYQKTQPNYRESLACNENDIDAALEGHFAMSQQFFAEGESRVINNRTVNELKLEISNGSMSENIFMAPSYVGFVYDAVFLYAKALSECMKTNPEYPLNIIQNVTYLTRAMENVKFDGISGPFQMSDNFTRHTTKEVLRWENGSWNKVFTFKNNTLKLVPDVILWKDGETPWDGIPSPLYAFLPYVWGGLGAICVIVLTHIYTKNREKAKYLLAKKVSFIYT